MLRSSLALARDACWLARLSAVASAARLRVAPPLLHRHFAAAAGAAPGGGASAAAAYTDLDETAGSLDAVVSGRAKVVTYYTAAWCGPCRAIAPVFSALAKEHPDVAFVKIDIDSNPTTAEKAGISAVPSFKLFLHGKQSAQFSGANASTLKAAVATLHAAL